MNHFFFCELLSISLLQYYDETFPTAKEQKAFEKNLFNKTHRANGMDRLLHRAKQITKKGWGKGGK